MGLMRKVIVSVLLLIIGGFSLNVMAAIDNEAVSDQAGKNSFNSLGKVFKLNRPDSDKRKIEAQNAVDALSLEIQSLKQSVITLNKDVRVLEEALLFPANTQVVVFLSQDMGKFFTLQNVKVKINGKVVTSHLYTDQERYALTHSGVQRLLLTNLSNGKHELSAVFTGKDSKGRDLKRATTLEIEKEGGAKYVEFHIADSNSRKSAEFSVRQW